LLRWAAMRAYRVVVTVLAGFAALAFGLAAPQGRITGDVVPGANWETVSPESVGYSSAKLEALRGWVKTQDTGSMLVIVQGRVIFSYGDVSHISKVASVRKSVLGMLYGKYVMNGKIDPSKTVKQLGLEDKLPFLPIEEKATLEQLMAARSGIYIPTANEQQRPPPRGSEYPGTHYFYNNWDFDAVGTAFEKLTGQGIYEALQTIPKARRIHLPERRHQRRQIPDPVARRHLLPGGGMDRCGGFGTSRLSWAESTKDSCRERTARWAPAGRFSRCCRRRTWWWCTRWISIRTIGRRSRRRAILRCCR
jgi:hypothetical protein